MTGTCPRMTWFPTRRVRRLLAFSIISFMVLSFIKLYLYVRNPNDMTVSAALVDFIGRATRRHDHRDSTTRRTVVDYGRTEAEVDDVDPRFGRDDDEEAAVADGAELQEQPVQEYGAVEEDFNDEKRAAKGSIDSDYDSSEKDEFKEFQDEAGEANPVEEEVERRFDASYRDVADAFGAREEDADNMKYVEEAAPGAIGQDNEGHFRPDFDGSAREVLSDFEDGQMNSLKDKSDHHPYASVNEDVKNIYVKSEDDNREMGMREAASAFGAREMNLDNNVDRDETAPGAVDEDKDGRFRSNFDGSARAVRNGFENGRISSYPVEFNPRLYASADDNVRDPDVNEEDNNRIYAEADSNNGFMAIADVNADGEDVNADKYDANADGEDVNADKYDANSDGEDVNADKYDANSDGEDVNADKYDANANGEDVDADKYDANSDGDDEGDSLQNEKEQPDAVDDNGVPVHDLNYEEVGDFNRAIELEADTNEDVHRQAAADSASNDEEVDETRVVQEENEAPLNGVNNESGDISFNGKDSLREELHTLLATASQLYCRSWISVGGMCDCKISEELVGRFMDGDKQFCLDHLSDDCRVMSFGINNDFSFDLAMEQLGCTVHAFDPTMNRSSFRRSERVFFHDLGLGSEDGLTAGLRVATLDTALQLVGWQEGVIDYIKLDVEASEWTALLEAMQSPHSPLRRVKQLGIEFHLFQWQPLMSNSPKSLEVLDDNVPRFIDVVAKLKSLGFRMIDTKPYLKIIYVTLWLNENLMSEQHIQPHRDNGAQ